MDHTFSDQNYSKVCKIHTYTTSHSFFNYFSLIFQICTVQWLNCTNLKYEQNRSYNGGGVVYVLKVRHLDQHDSMGLSPNVHPLMNDSLSWKVFFIQYGRISRRHFHHLAMNSYLHPKISPWQITILCIQWNRRISVIMILDVLCPEFWCLITSSWV